MLTDIEIAQSAKMEPIVSVANRVGILEDDLELYGKYKAKIAEHFLKQAEKNADGKLILVTAINPTPAGEGKTTTTIGLGEAMGLLGKKAMIALREPSMGPVMGIKGGAAGGGYAQVVPMDDINLHFTGDMHAITSANNLLCAMIDNHIAQGNDLNIDVRRVCFKRVMDMNDRALRQVTVGLGGTANGYPREDGFMITVASEVMAIFCLAKDRHDLKERLGRIIVAYDKDKKPITAKDLKADGAMTLLLAEALQPNLVQTLEKTPCLMHGGPFANIAHGCNSIRATRLALKTADYAITEAGFGADLGAEKFMDITCRSAGFSPCVTVIVATVRALKYNGGVLKENLGTEDLDALKRGIVNLGKHIENMRSYGVSVVVAINRFATDSPAELAYIKEYCHQNGARCALSDVFLQGGKGGLDLARAVIEEADKFDGKFQLLYKDELPLQEKIQTIVTKIYGGKGVEYAPAASRQLAELEKLGFGNLPICIAKTQYSLSDDPRLLGRPSDFNVTVREVRVSAGAGFVVVLTGSILTMPGLPKKPAAEKIDIDDDGVITGLF